ncbi:MAG: 2-hydroxyglutaryl-CoA dehydratase [Deltaproteobacteria bacterium]|nr:2-hydroxyglutaryl-CoA dehydratase [Deltaproteobacteria bacterium]
MEHVTEPKRARLPILGDRQAPSAELTDAEIEAQLAAFEEGERERLQIKRERRQWADTMLDPQMKKKERDRVTLLMGGLTAAQDFLIEGAIGGLGYKARHLDCPDNAALQVGKEFGNRAQCNPTYFTVGGLVKELQRMRDQEGKTAQQIIDDYVFVTAGACGPCRFGMYVTEYRKALRDAGFDGFRVMLFQQQGGLSQATGEDVGLEMNPEFFIAIVKAVVCGDVLNALGYRIRPYEVEAGATNRALEEAKKIVYAALHDKTNVFVALWKARQVMKRVEVDRLRPRAKTSIIGEFWAMTTEGDGNYQLQKFLESEGAENDIQLTTAWLLYNIWEVARDTRERRDLRGADGGKHGLAELDEIGVAKRLATLRLAELGLRVGFQCFAQPAGLHGYHLPDMDLVAEVANEHYSNDLRGGEGHMEVGKLIVNALKSKANITVSVKPFGCMPSSGVSDGVQSLITARFPGTIFCAVETSGDGAANFYSRIQMYMFKARIAAEAELEKALADTGVTLEQVRAFVDASPKHKNPLYYPAHTVSSTAANLVYEVAPYITQSRAERMVGKAKSALGAIVGAVGSVPGFVGKARHLVTDPQVRERIRYDIELVRDLARGKALEQLEPLMTKLGARFERYEEPSVTQPAINTYQDTPIAAE